MDISFVARKLQRSIAGLGLATVLASSLLTGTAFAKTFDDVASSYFAYGQIDALSDEGIMTGDGATGLFLPEDNLTREQAAKILVEAFLGGVDDSAEVTCTGDVSSWAEGYMATANLYGVIEGEGDGSCNAAGYMNRASFAAAVVRAANLSGSGFLASEMFTDVSADAWYDDDMGILYENGVMSGYAGTTHMGPGDNVTRGQAAKMVYNAMNPVYTPVNGDDTDTDTDTTDATLMVEVSDESPDSMTIANEATGVTVAAWDFTADGDDATVEALTVRQYAVSTLPSDHEVYLYNGSERLTSGVSVNSTTNEVVFNNVDEMIPDGETVTLSLRLNVGDVGSSTTQVGFEIEDVDMVETDAMSVEGDFPAKADEHGISTTSVSTVSIEKNGSITNPNVGDKDVVVAKFTVNAGTNSAAVQELGLYASGSIATTEIENFNLYRSGEDTPLATVDMVDDQDVVRFVLDGDYSDDADMCGSTEGYCLENGSSRNFEVRADLNTGRSDDTLKFYIDENVDVFAVDADYGFGAKITSTDYDGDSCTTSSGDCSYSTLQGGDITMTRHNIENTNAAVNQDDVMIMDFTISTETDATFNNFVLKLDADETIAGSGLLSASGASNFTDIRVKALDGSFTWGPIDADQLLQAIGDPVISDSSDGSGYYVFTDDLALDAGDSVEFGVYVDVENQTALNNDGITASVYINSSYPEIKDSNNKVLTNTDSLVPTSTFSGDEFTIKSNSLTVALYSGVGSATEVIGTEDAVLGAFSLTAGDANDIDLTKLTATGYFDTNTSGTFVAGSTFSSIVTNLALYAESVDSDNLLDEAGADSDGLIEFSDADYTIPAGTTVVFYVTGDIANNSSYNDYRVKVDIADVSADVEAEDESGDSVSAASTDASNGGTADSGTRITVSSGGTLSIDIPSSTRSSQIVVAGTDDNTMSQLKFTATRENFKVYKIALKNDYSAAVGDYDDNIAALRVNYFTDEEQTEEASVTCSSSATSGVYTCNFPTTAPLMVPDSDLAGVPDYSLATVEVDLNTTASDLADEGDKPNLTFSLTYDFEARGVESNKLVEEAGTNDVTVTDAAITAYSDTVTGYDAVQIDGAISSATATTIVVEDSGSADPGDINLVGAFLCYDTDADATATCDSGEEQMYVTAYTDGTNDDTLTVIRGVNGTTAAAMSDNVSVLVIPPSVALLTNYMQVQATDVDLTQSSSSRTGSASTAESVLTFTATANDAKMARVRTGLGEGDYAEATDPNEVSSGAGTMSATAVTSTPTPLVGSYAYKLSEASGLDTDDGGSISTGTDLSAFSKASVWVYVHDDATTGDTMTGASIFTSASGTAATTQTPIFSSTVLEDTWLFYGDVAVTPVSGQTYAGLVLDDGMTDTADYVAFDDLRFYNERVNVDLTLNETWFSTTPTVAYLIQNDQTVATGYVYFSTTTAGQVIFTPVGTYGDIEIEGADTFQVKMNTTAAIDNGSTATEQLTARIDMGNVTTAGDFSWYDGASILTFLGVNSTDKIEMVSSY